MLHGMVHAITVGSCGVVSVGTHLLHALHWPIVALVWCALQTKMQDSYMLFVCVRSSLLDSTTTYRIGKHQQKLQLAMAVS